MADREFKPGRRSVPYGNRKLSEGRFGWVRTFVGQFVILVSTSEGDGDLNVSLYHPRERGAPVTLALTELTEEELLAMKNLFDKAFELALPTTRRRDEIADEAFQRGDDSYARSYRQVPQLVYRQRTLDAHRESVQERHEPVPASSWGGLPDDRGSGGLGNGVAEQHPERGESQDDGPSPD